MFLFALTSNGWFWGRQFPRELTPCLSFISLFFCAFLTDCHSSAVSLQSVVASFRICSQFLLFFCFIIAGFNQVSWLVDWLVDRLVVLEFVGYFWIYQVGLWFLGGFCWFLSCWLVFAGHARLVSEFSVCCCWVLYQVGNFVGFFPDFYQVVCCVLRCLWIGVKVW